jgi:hypothetical protein
MPVSSIERPVSAFRQRMLEELCRCADNGAARDLAISAARDRISLARGVPGPTRPLGGGRGCAGTSSDSCTSLIRYVHTASTAVLGDRARAPGRGAAEGRLEGMTGQSCRRERPDMKVKQYGRRFY